VSITLLERAKDVPPFCAGAIEVNKFNEI